MPRKLFIFLVLPVLGSASLAFAAYSYLAPRPEDKFQAACIELLKRRLQLPDSFELLDWRSPVSDKATFEEYALASLGEHDIGDAVRIGGKSPAELQRESFDRHDWLIFVADLLYFAEDPTGDPAIKNVTCEHISTSFEEFSEVDALQISIDGLSHHEWLEGP
ncbi:hypothetical protein T8T21_00880 [Limimaricola variabilis]|uniref:hypothetical protein n=1 Tax=Limimaricola variabilis TaxID=1492771 RepID=UPI002AC9A245|nr:hypothetical protein [Limimaricola variabilis]WPY94713.1 hypothetical protein T8T21_00880 [Limimaricola variabilis]